MIRDLRARDLRDGARSLSMFELSLESRGRMEIDGRRGVLAFGVCRNDPGNRGRTKRRGTVRIAKRTRHRREGELSEVAREGARFSVGQS